LVPLPPNNSNNSNKNSKISWPSTSQPDTVEDDEEDELRFTTNPQKPNPPPIVEDHTLRPEFVVDKGEGTLFEFSQLPPSSSTKKSSVDYDTIKPTPSLQTPAGESVYPTLVLETNSDNGLVEIVTKYETLPVVSPTGSLQTPMVSSASVSPYPDEDYYNDNRKHVTSLSTVTTQSSTGGASTPTSLSPQVTSSGPQSIHSFPTPPLRPGNK
jgi:hypothetical protein